MITTKLVIPEMPSQEDAKDLSDNEKDYHDITPRGSREGW